MPTTSMIGQLNKAFISGDMCYGMTQSHLALESLESHPHSIHTVTWALKQYRISGAEIDSADLRPARCHPSTRMNLRSSLDRRSSLHPVHALDLGPRWRWQVSNRPNDR